MAGLLDFVSGLMGQANPSAQLGQALQGPNPSPMAPGGPQAGAGGAPGAGGPPGPGGPPAGTGGPPQGPQAPPTPQLYQTPPDMAAMNQQLASPGNLIKTYMDMQAQQYRGEQFNTGLAMLLGGMKGPPDQLRTMIGAAQGLQQPDAGKTMSNILQLYQTQQGLQQRQAFINSLPDLEKQFPGMTQAELYAMGPEAVQELLKVRAQGQMPTPEMRNFNQAREMVKSQVLAANPNATADDIAKAQEQAVPTSLLVSGVANLGPDYSRFLVDPNGFKANKSFTQWQQEQIMSAQSGKEKELASTKVGDISAKTDELVNNIDTILNDKNLDNYVGGGLGARAFRTKAGLGGEGSDLAGNIAQLSGQTYGESYREAGMGGSKRTGAEVAGIASGLSQINQTQLSPDQYRTVLQTLRYNTLRAKADAYAEAGRDPPDEVAGYVDPSYYEQGGLLAGHDKPKFISAPNKPGGGQPAQGGAGGGRGGGGEGSGGGMAPQAAIDLLKAHPEHRGDFDAKYGAGASAKVLGQ